jgi:DNA-binding transcriptional ArsR family regulator
METKQTTAMMRALAHPMRVRILSRMNAPKRRLSPTGFCDETGLELSKVSYHFRCLARVGLIREVEQIPVRGSTKHVYVAEDRTEAWSREYESLPEAVRQAFAATALREGVEAVGRSIDAGVFDSRKGSHLSWDSMWVDDKGWERLTTLFDRTLKEAFAIRDQCAARMPRPIDEGAWVASYFMSAFPSPPPPDEPPRSSGH